MKRYLAGILSFVIVLAVFSGLDATEQALMNAVRRGNLAEVKKYLDLGFTQEVVDSSGRNLLLQAAAYGHLNLVEFFIGNRANINKMDHKGNTILHFLADSRSGKAPALIKQALQNGAFLGAKNYDGQTPAGNALARGNAAAFKVFLESGYDKNSVEGNMPVVMFAYLKGQNAIVKSLMEAGADVNRADSNGETMLHHAAMRNDAGMVNGLLGSGAQINAKSSSGRTALMYALEKNRIPIAEALIKKGADVNATDRQRQNILHYLAPLVQAPKLITLLPSEGLNINARDDSGRTPLLIAAMSARWNNVELFASKGADVNIADSSGKTPALMAAEKGNPAVVKSLLDRGADMRKSDATGQTVLHHLAGQRGKAVLQLIPEIITKGGQVNAKNAAGATPAGMAIAGGNTAVFQLLLESGIDKDGLEQNSLPLAVFAYEKKQKDIAKTLLEKGSDIKKTGSRGETMLHAVAAQDDWQFANLALGYNPDLNARDDTGRTPLLSAIDKSAIRVAGLLIEKGADVNVKDRQGQTSLHYLAAARNATGLMEKAKAAGIKVDAKDNAGRTPLAIAVESNRVDNVEYLLNMGADVNGTDHNGVDLILVAYGKNRAMLNLFITKGARLDVKAPDGKTLLLLGLEQNDTQLLTLLTEKGANVNERQANGKYPLEFAIEKRSVNNVKLLLDSKADYKVRDAKGNPLLALAIEKRTDGIAKLLLDKGADPNGRDTANRHHLQHAFDENQPAIFKELLDHNADANVKDAGGASILSLAAEKNRPVFMRYLFDKNVEVNAQDANANTPLIVASWKGYYEPVKLLVDKGAAVNHKGQEGETALFKTIDAPYNAGIIITLLAKQGGDVKAVNTAGDTLLHRSVKARKFGLFEQFLKLGADPNIANKSGDTLLMQLSNIEPPSGKGAGSAKMAAENRDSLKLIGTLLKNGADPNVMNRYGQTALNYSRVKRNFDIVKTLLGAGAKVDLQDKSGNTVLKKEIMDYVGNYRMLDSLKQQSQKMIDLFVGSGGDINKPDKFGVTALTHVAKEFNPRNEKKVLDIVPYLMGKGARKDIRDSGGKSAEDYARQSGNSELIRLVSGGY